MSFPLPIICVNDRVLLHYAVLDDTVGYNSGHGLFFVGEKEIGRVPCLAICHSAQVMLYYCDADWSMIGVASYDSVSDAKRRAERIYPGSSARWVQSQFTEEDATRWLNEATDSNRCSFCGKRPHDDFAASFFQGKGGAWICSDCVREFSVDLSERPKSNPSSS